MKTAKQILIDNDCLQEPDRIISTNMDRFIQAMKDYASQTLDLASEKARMMYHDGYHKSNSSTGHVQIGADNIQIDKQSILNLKSQLL